MRRRHHKDEEEEDDDLGLSSSSVHAASFPKRKYSFDTNEPRVTLHQAVTPDGVTLTLKQYEPRVSSTTTNTKTSPVPIILAHGLAGNSCPLDAVPRLFALRSGLYRQAVEHARLWHQRPTQQGLEFG